MLNYDRDAPPIIFSTSGNLWWGLLLFRSCSKARFRFSFLGTEILYKSLNIIDRYFNNEAVNKIVAWSEYTKNTWVKFGISEEKIVVIPPGFPNPLKLANQDSDTVNLLFIAGKGKFFRKGVLLVYKAFKLLRQKYRNIRLFIVGDYPEYLPKLEGMKTYGFIPLWKLYNQVYPESNVLVLPTYADAFPTATAEAQGFGIPVISTWIWAIPEIVVHEKTGFLIRPGDFRGLVKYLELLIEDPSLRKSLGNNAREHFLKKFSIDVVRSQYRELYECIINER